MQFHRLALCRLAAAALALGATFAAGAAPLVIDSGTDFNLEPNGSTRTARFDQMGFSGLLNTNIFLGDASQAGVTVVSTNIPAIMNFYGFSAGAKTTLNGSSVNLAYPSVPGQNNIDTLNNPSAPDLNGFTGGVAFPQYGAGNVGGLGGAWGMTMSYQIVGTTVDSDNNGSADSVHFTTGIVQLFYQSAATDPNNGKEVLRLVVNDSDANDLTGVLDYSYAVGDTFIQNFFRDGSGGNSLYSLWQASPQSFTMTSPGAGIAGPGTLWNSGSALIAQNSVDIGTITINPDANRVPEPASLLLAGLALAAAGASRRRRA